MALGAGFYNIYGYDNVMKSQSGEKKGLIEVREMVFDLEARPQTLSDALRKLKNGVMELLHCDLCYKDLDPMQRQSMDLDLVAHTGEFCLMVKEQPQGAQACLEGCMIHSFGDWNREKGLLKKCHAGVLEVVVPVRVDGRDLGTLHLGPFRDQSRDKNPSAPRNAVGLRCYDELPIWDEGRVAKVLPWIMSILLRDMRDFRSVESWTSSSAMNPAVLMVCRALESQPHMGHRLSTWAQKTHLSESRLTHLIKEHTRMSFREIKLVHVMERARRLLLHTPWSVLRISEALAYESQHSFSRSFTKVHGLSPRAYREQVKDPESIHS